MSTVSRVVRLLARYPSRLQAVEKSSCSPRNILSCTRGMFMVSTLTPGSRLYRNQLLPSQILCTSSLLVRRSMSARAVLTEDVITERVMHICKNRDKITAEKVQLESNFMSDLGLDSLDHVELIMAVEDEFGFEISDTDAEKLVRPLDIVRYLAHRQDVEKK